MATSFSQHSIEQALPNLPVIGEKPYQPTGGIEFPKREYKKSKTSVVKRSFHKDVAPCHTCVTAVKSGKIRSLGTGNLAFVSRGYCNWKDATGVKGAFNTHQSSSTHKTAVELVVTLPSTTRNVGEMIYSEYARERKSNRDCLLKVFQNIQFLSRQGITLRGDNDETNR